MTPARLIDATPVVDDWWLIRLAWTGEAPQPGQWLWLDVNDRRVCLPVRDADAGEGWLAGVIPGTALPGPLGPGTRVHISALQGNAVAPANAQPLLILGEDLGIGPALALAERHAAQVRLVLLGGCHGIPGRLAPSRFFVPALTDTAIAGVSSLEQAGVPARIALADERPGVHEGRVAELLGRYLADTPQAERQALELVAFTPWGALQSAREALVASLRAVQLVELPRGQAGL